MEYTSRVTVPFKENETRKTRSKRVVRDEKLNFNKFIQQFGMNLINLDSLEGFWILKAKVFWIPESASP